MIISYLYLIITHVTNYKIHVININGTIIISDYGNIDTYCL